MKNTDSAPRKSRSFIQDVWYRFKKEKLAILGLVILLIIFATAILGGFLLDYEKDIITQDIPNKLASPSFQHIFGTDGFGRDIFYRIVWGARYSLLIGFSGSIIGLLVGGLMGAVAGYMGGTVDAVFMRIIDMFIALPTTILAVAIVSVLGPSLTNLIVAISIANVPSYARLTRSSVLTIKDNEFIEASTAVGGNGVHIMMQHILPNVLATLIVQLTMGVGWSITTAAGLSYLGLGVTPPDPEWGNMLSEGRDVMRYNSNLVIFPGLFIMVTVLALNLVGDGIRDAVDPKLKN